MPHCIVQTGREAGTFQTLLTAVDAAGLGVPMPWRTEILEWRPPFGFIDVRLTGAYRRWEHTHRLTQVDGGTEISDRMSTALPTSRLLTWSWQ